MAALKEGNLKWPTSDGAPARAIKPEGNAVSFMQWHNLQTVLNYTRPPALVKIIGQVSPQYIRRITNIKAGITIKI